MPSVVIIMNKGNCLQSDKGKDDKDYVPSLRKLSDQLSGESDGEHSHDYLFNNTGKYY